MAKRFDGKVVVITGASAGIGWASAIRFAGKGAKVVLAARRRDRLEELAREIEAEGGKALVVPTDVSDPAALAGLIGTIVDQLGGIDVLVNNAGFGLQELFEHVTPEQGRRLLEVNLFAVLEATRLAMPHLKRSRGIVVNVASVAGLIPMPVHAHYSASKHALVGWAESLAYEVHDDGVRIVTVCPGPVDTEFQSAMEGTPIPKWLEEQFKWSIDTADAIARGVVRAARRRRSGTVLPTLRSHLVYRSYGLLGPIARLALRWYVRRVKPSLGGGAHDEEETKVGPASRRQAV